MNCPFSLLSVDTTPVFQMPNVIFVCQHFSKVLKKHIVWKSISLFIIWQNRYLRSQSRDICFFSGNCWYVKQCTFCLLQLNPTHIAYLLFPTFLHSACLNYIFPILPSLFYCQRYQKLKQRKNHIHIVKKKF